MRSRQCNDFLVIETHTVKDLAQMILRLGRVGQAAILNNLAAVGGVCGYRWAEAFRKRTKSNNSSNNTAVTTQQQQYSSNNSKLMYSTGATGAPRDGRATHFLDSHHSSQSPQVGYKRTKKRDKKMNAGETGEYLGGVPYEMFGCFFFTLSSRSRAIFRPALAPDEKDSN